MDINVDDIRTWHVRDNKWSDVGYHYVITRRGEVQTGRDEQIPGAHCYGKNKSSIGVCVVGGKDNYTGEPKDTRNKEQRESITKLLGWLQDKYPNTEVYGHNEFNKGKSCPNFSVEEYKNGR